MWKWIIFLFLLSVGIGMLSVKLGLLDTQSNAKRAGLARHERPMTLGNILDARDMEKKSEEQILAELRVRDCTIPNEEAAIEAALQKLYKAEFSREFRDAFEDFVKTRGSVWEALPEDMKKAAELEKASKPPAYASKIWGLILGVSNYEDTAIPDLMFAEKDAGVFCQYLLSLGVPEKQLYYLTETRATLSNIKKSLEEIQQKARKDEIIMVFFSGHGGADAQGELYFLMQDTDTAQFAETAYPMADFRTMLQGMPTEKVIAFLDACHSGRAAKAFQVKDVQMGALSREHHEKIAMLARRDSASSDGRTVSEDFNQQIAIFSSSQEDKYRKKTQRKSKGYSPTTCWKA